MKTKPKWKCCVAYPCNVVVSGTAKRIPLVCPVHGYAHPGKITVRYEVV